MRPAWSICSHYPGTTQSSIIEPVHGGAKPPGAEMNSATQPVGSKHPHVADEDAVRECLDLLASGDCDQGAFLQSMRERFQFEAEGNWEALSQLDQYYRRGKIQAEVYLEIKTALAGYALDHTVPASTVPRKAEKPPPAANQALRPGAVLRDRYRITHILGQGGMGTVFEAIDDFRLEAPPTNRLLAVKVLHSAVTRRAELLTELQREFQHAQLLSHPNIVRVYEFDRDGPQAFFTMELLHGELLSQILQARKRVPLERPHALAVLRDVGAAIAHAHSRGVVHGDINPRNIFITTHGELRVLDFGASHTLSVAVPAPGDEAPPGGFATPGYASCQVLEGERPDARDDLFALA
jgi:hypothetical protein